MGVEVTLDIKELDRIVAQLPDAVERVVEAQSDAIYAVAKHGAPRKSGRLQDDSDVESGEDRYTRYIHFRAPYALYVHEGTRYMMGRPFLRIAIEQRRKAFQEALQSLAGLMKED